MCFSADWVMTNWIRDIHKMWWADDSEFRFSQVQRFEFLDEKLLEMDGNIVLDKQIDLNNC